MRKAVLIIAVALVAASCSDGEPGVAGSITTSPGGTATRQTLPDPGLFEATRRTMSVDLFDCFYLSNVAEHLDAAADLGMATGLFVAGTMTLVQLWFNANRKKHREEIEALLEIARSEKH